MICCHESTVMVPDVNQPPSKAMGTTYFNKGDRRLHSLGWNFTHRIDIEWRRSPGAWVPLQHAVELFPSQLQGDHSPFHCTHHNHSSKPATIRPSAHLPFFLMWVFAWCAHGMTIFITSFYVTLLPLPNASFGSLQVSMLTTMLANWAHSTTAVMGGIP